MVKNRDHWTITDIHRDRSVTVTGRTGTLQLPAEGVTLVDTLLPKKVDLITAGLKKIGRSFEDVTAILITHSHADHAGGASAVCSSIS